ncbi:SHOCT domain-containing protein [Gordonia sp. CPCC 205333]|uniref:SHOCT domain-containing protein n=1 Tax=Gordonia sp. CPCC 205333 TaxID=3140790 RepID=UPI003AF34C44
MTTMFGEAGAKSTGGSGFLGAFLKSLAFIMVCGIVGPIFLVMYFVIDEPGIGWMLWTGLGVTILNVVIAFFVARGSANFTAKMTRMQATGHMALADITSLRQTNMQINDQPVMQLGLRIHGDGIPTFDVDIRKTVPIVAQAMLHRRVLAVLVDPATREFEIDWQATGMITGSVPAQFTSSEDGRTYDLTGQPEPLIKILEVLRKYGVGNSGTIDLRGNPLARAEVMAIVRQYGAGAQSATSPYGGAGQAGVAPTSLTKPTPHRSLTERLAELDNLYSAGRIDAAEYQQARQRVLGDL